MSSPVAIPAIDESCCPSALDLSNRDLIGGSAVCSALEFINSAAPDCKLPLSSIDLSHNRLGDDGAAELARILHENAPKLGSLVSLNLYENGIRDHGARALLDVIQKHGASTLLELESVELHDNDISEAVLSAFDDAWTAINATRPAPFESGKPFGKMLVDKMRAVKIEIEREKERIERTKKRIEEEKRREAERIREACVVSTLVKLQPLIQFLKEKLWDFVAKQRKTLVNPTVLHVFRLPTESEQRSMPVKYGVLHLTRNWDTNSTWHWYRDKSIAELPAFRAKLMAQVPRCLLVASDEPGMLFPLATRDTADQPSVDAVAAKIASFHSLLEAARTEAAVVVGSESGLTLVNEALSRDLAMVVSVSTSDVHLNVSEATSDARLHDAETVQFYTGGSPFAVYCTSDRSSLRYSAQTTHLWTASAFDITLNIPGADKVIDSTVHDLDTHADY